MKKTITLLFAIFLALGISAQNFGVGLDFMMLSGTMIESESGTAVQNAAGEDVSGSSAVLNVNYTHNLSEKLDMVGSVGLGMGFGLVPMKLGMSYGMTSKIDVNVGMGMYMISDDSYVPYEGTIGEDEWKGSSNEFGMNFGVAYNMNAIGIGLGYDMIKGDGNITLNALTISLSYAFGADDDAVKTKTNKTKK